ncbi:hypothetical protein GALL_432330 [mine drainage metagenome]|uniref:Uncharacterized protein n=1 Tax=mine drainage metagenome TaxID=410659 RepID=A0A1J5PW44_9ZZZZ
MNHLFDAGQFFVASNRLSRARSYLIRMQIERQRGKEVEKACGNQNNRRQSHREFGSDTAAGARSSHRWLAVATPCSVTHDYPKTQLRALENSVVSMSRT